jgi:hypothetical protein
MLCVTPGGTGSPWIQRGTAMRPGALSVLAITPILWLVAMLSSAHAFDLNGAWASDVKLCSKIFERKGTAFSFRHESELHGSGFIIEGKTIRGKAAKCAIKARKDDGEIINLVASCATDIMLSDVQFSLRVVTENKVLRTFPGMEGIEVAYDRCPL